MKAWELLVLLTSALLGLGLLGAAQAQDEEVIDLGEIEVTGTAPPAEAPIGDAVEVDIAAAEVAAVETSLAQTVITADQFGGAQTVAEILERIPGADVRSLGGSGQLANVHLRGSRSNQVLVLIDGMPVADGAVDLSALPLGMAQRIEVYRGAGASRWGGGAMGGVINIVTQSDTDGGAACCGEAGDATAVEIRGGSYGQYGATLQYSSGGDSLYVSHDSATNDYHFSRGSGAAAARQNNDANITQAWGGWSSGGATYLAGVTALERGVPGSAEFPTLQANLEQQRLMLSRASPSQLSGLRITHSHFTDPEPYLGGAAIDTEDTQLHFEHSFVATTGTRHDLRLKPRLDLIDSMGYGAKQRAGLDASWRGAWHDGPATYELELGSVMSEGVGLDPVGRAGVAVQVHDSVDIFGSVGYSVRHPAFDELYLADMGSVRGNPDLQPERVLTADAGVRVSTESTLVEAAAFLSEYQDSIVFAPVSAYLVEASNTGRARVAGVELALDQHLGGDCWWRTAGTWLPLAEYDSGVPLSGRSAQHVNSRLELADGGWSGALEYDYTGEIPADLFGSLVIEPRSLVSVEMARELWTGSASLAVSNLFDEDARDTWNYPLPGRAVTLTWRIEL